MLDRVSEERATLVSAPNPMPGTMLPGTMLPMAP
jgi:hypothetical protein